MASFAFRLLMAKLPSYLGSYKVSLDRLTDMLLVATEIKEYFLAEKDGPAERFWAKREKIILYALINCGLAVCTYIIVKPQEVVAFFFQFSPILLSHSCFRQKISV